MKLQIRKPREALQLIIDWHVETGGWIWGVLIISISVLWLVIDGLMK